MRTSWLATALVAAAASTVHAEAFIAGHDTAEARPVPTTSTIRIGAPTAHVIRPGRQPAKTSGRVAIDRAALAMWAQHDTVIATLTVEVRGFDASTLDVVIPLELPAGAKATALAVTIDGARAVASAMTTAEASQFYRDTVNAGIDPALLEGEGQSYKLHVYPVTRAMPGTVDITLEFPRTDHVAIEPRGIAIGTVATEVASDAHGMARTSWTNVTSARATRIPQPPPSVIGLAIEPRPAVGATMSLVAGWGTRRGVVPTVTIGNIGGRAYQHRSIDKAMIRRRIKLDHNRIRYCYEREAQRDNTLAGDVILRFSVTPDGAVTLNAMEGTLSDPAVKRCIADVVALWSFSPHDDGRVDINYPLTFRLAGN